LQFVKINYEVSGMRGSYILLWIYNEVRMVSFVGKE